MSSFQPKAPCLTGYTPAILPSIKADQVDTRIFKRPRAFPVYLHLQPSHIAVILSKAEATQVPVATGLQSHLCLKARIVYAKLCCNCHYQQKWKDGHHGGWPITGHGLSRQTRTQNVYIYST